MTDNKETSFAQRLVEAGYSDFYILDQETATHVMTRKRKELLHTIQNQDITSIRGLARQLDRDIKSVHTDLNLLFRNGIIEYREEQNRKIPVIPYTHIFIQPLL